MGTPGFAIPSLTMLIASDNTIAGVVTQPDRPSGRGKKLTPPPVKTLALQHALPVLQPERVKEENFIISDSAPITKSLQGSFKAPKNFDYKEELSKSLTKKYLNHG